MNLSVAEANKSDATAGALNEEKDKLKQRTKC